LEATDDLIGQLASSVPTRSEIVDLAPQLDVED
jgi:hypothetical protein